MLIRTLKNIWYAFLVEQGAEQTKECDFSSHKRAVTSSQTLTHNKQIPSVFLRHIILCTALLQYHSVITKILQKQKYIAKPKRKQ